MGNCLAGESCIFSHDPALLVDRLNLGNNGAMMGSSPSQFHPTLQVQDFDAFPALQSGVMSQWSKPSSVPHHTNTINLSGSQAHSNVHNNLTTAPRRPMVPRSISTTGAPSSPKSNGSRPTSRHQSRAPTPSIPPVDDNEAFPSLGSIGGKGGKKHHGKRGGHGHGHSNKENVPNSLADVVRNSPSPAPSLLRKGLMKRESYTGSRENCAAANAIPAPQHVPWLETGDGANQAYMKARQEAFKHGGLRNKFLQR